MKQRHYHLYILLLALALLASGGLLVYGLVSGWGWLPLGMCGVVCLTLLYIMWRAASFLPDQVKYFLGALLSHDTMSRFPDTGDEELRQMYSHMNQIMQTYAHTQIELETKRMYYDRILRIMTHELRNSITPIITLSEDMLRREYSSEDSHEAIEVINEQCTSIKQFLDSYYQLTHLPQPNLHEVDVRAFLQSFETLYASQGVSCQCAQGLKLTCDEGMIKQVLNNLIKNAIEAIGSEKVPSVVITASAPEGNPRITVSDNGPGIPANKQEEIFLPFYTSKATGTGIGLALSRQIMNMHKGSLSCSASQQGGAMFILQFE